MAFNINSFKTNGLNLDGARAAYFNIIFTPPTLISNAPTAAAKFAFTCRGAELPASTIGVIEVPYFGRKIKVAGDRTFEDWQVTVMNDEEFSVRTMFEAWSNYINSLISNTRDPSMVSENSGSYKVDMTINQYGKAGGAPIAGYVMSGAWPSDISAIAVDWEDTNKIETFNVRFAYDYWVPATTGQILSTTATIDPYNNDDSSN